MFKGFMCSVYAGTNFLTRSMAFQEAGWSPTYTLTEDFALGMYLKANKWHCRYVEEYLAIGEAPDQVRNCFQQRSRWCKVTASLRKQQGKQDRESSLGAKLRIMKKWGMYKLCMPYDRKVEGQRDSHGHA